MTANDEFGIDASAFFNLLSGYGEPPVWNKLVMAPLGLREKIYSLINNEINMVNMGKEGHIIAKMNSLSIILLSKSCTRLLLRACILI